MARFSDLPVSSDGRFAENLALFASALRRAGLRISAASVLDAVQALRAAGFSSREDFYWILHACFVRRPEERVIFAEAFRLFWRDPQFLEQLMSLLLPAVRGVQEERKAAPGEKRAAEALLAEANRTMPPPEEPPAEMQVDASRTASARERLKTLDFEQMSTAEMAEAKKLLAAMTLPVEPRKSRRFAAAVQGRADPRATLRQALRRGGEVMRLAKRQPRPKKPNLVVICDISGSMAAYSRAMLHFLHAVANDRSSGWGRVHGFTFGTRLTNISRHLSARDVDQALAAAGAEAQDWQGGTRIGEALHAFNRDWSRRVLTGDTVVVLITDGLDRGDPADLARAAERLSLSARRLIWINPLLRWEGFLPQAQGIRALLPHVHSMRAGHNIASIAALAQAISRREDGGEKARLLALMRDLS